MNRNLMQQRMRIFIGLSLFIFLLELVGGWYTNSLALISDAGHVFTDILALLLTYVALHLSQKASDKKYTFGYRRAEIFAAITNGIVLILITLYISYEAYLRFQTPEPLHGVQMLVVAIIGLIANIYVLVKMHGDEHENLNVRSAYLHILTDTLSSVGVVVAAVLILVTGQYVIDPIISIIIALFIFASSITLIKEAGTILMEAIPAHINLDELRTSILNTKGVKDVHDLHVWSITSDAAALSTHVVIEATTSDEANRIIKDIIQMLEHKYKITHSTIQSEYGRCVGKDCGGEEGR